MAGIFGAPLAAANIGMDPRTLMAANEAARAMQQGMQAQPQMQQHTTQQMSDMAPPPMPQQYLAPKRTLSDKLGLLADAFSGSDRNTQLLMQREGQHRAEWQAQQSALMKRAQDFADWQQRFDYEQKFKTNEPRDQLTRYMLGAGIDPASPEAQAMYRQAAENSANPMQAVTVYGPDGSQGLQFIRPGQMGGGAPKAPVGRLTPIGGAAPQGAGDFRR